MSIRLLSSLLIVSHFCSGVPPINLFRPSDRPLFPDPVSTCWTSEATVTYEGSFHVRAFRDTEEEEFGLERCWDQEKKVCVLDLYQERQNVLAAFKGLNADTPQGNLTDQFNLNDEAATQGQYRACGSLSIPMNLMFSYRYYFNHGLRLEFHLPVIHAELKDVCWRSLAHDKAYEGLLSQELLQDVTTLGGLRTQGWKRTGIGDFVVQAAWMRNYPQSRAVLQDVRVQARFGVVVPTGKKEDEDKLLAFPFGNDGAWALQFGGGLDLDFGYCVRGGIDVEFMYLFGNTRCRRVKTAAEQTDLFFLTKVPAYREFGLQQQYNIYLESYLYNTSFKLNYQFLKRNDDRLDLGSDRIDSVIANSAPSLFDWTAHSLIFMVRHDLFRDNESYWAFPSISAFVKYGFNGKRALLANTVGLQLNVDF
jgi:hypothetical protein